MVGMGRQPQKKVVKFGPRHPWHPHVGNQTGRAMSKVGRKKIIGPRERLYDKAYRSERSVVASRTDKSSSTIEITGFSGTWPHSQ